MTFKIDVTDKLTDGQTLISLVGLKYDLIYPLIMIIKSFCLEIWKKMTLKIDVNGPTDGPTDRPTDGPTDRPTEWLIESRARD